jgi:hypothetical protein
MSVVKSSRFFELISKAVLKLAELAIVLAIVPVLTRLLL